MILKTPALTPTQRPNNCIPKYRIIYLEKILEVVSDINGEKTYKEIERNNNQINLLNSDSIVISTYSVTTDYNPDDFLIEEERHDFFTYFGKLIYKNIRPSTFSNINASLFNEDDIILIDDFNYNIIYNRINRQQYIPEIYSRYETYRKVPPIRHNINKLVEFHVPLPNYYSYEEQKALYPESDPLDKIILQKFDAFECLHRLYLKDLFDDKTLISTLKVIFDDLSKIFLSHEIFRQHFMNFIYQMVSRIKFDMENFGIHTVTCIFSDSKGFNITNLSAKVNFTTNSIQKSLVMDFYTCMSRVYEDVFLPICSDLKQIGSGVRIFLHLEPLSNLVSVVFDNSDKQTNISQSDINENILNDLF